MLRPLSLSDSVSKVSRHLLTSETYRARRNRHELKHRRATDGSNNNFVRKAAFGNTGKARLAILPAVPSPIDRLDQAREEVLAASGTDFLRRLGEYVQLLHAEETIKSAVDELRQEVIDADAKLTEEDATFVAKLVPIRQRLAEDEAEIDDSDVPWPGPYRGLDPENARAFHAWMFTLANFDAIAEDREERVRVDGASDQLNTSRTQMLVAILNAKLHDLVYPFNERPAPRPDLMHLYDEMSEVGHEQTNAYRRVERVADENGYFALAWLEAVGESLEPQESRPLRSPEDKREVLEEALKKPDLFRLYEALRPTEARGPLSDSEREKVDRVEAKSRSELARLERPLRPRIESKEAAADKPRRMPFSRGEKLAAWQVGLGAVGVLLAAAAIIATILIANNAN